MTTKDCDFMNEDNDLNLNVRKILDRSYPNGYDEELFYRMYDWFFQVETDAAIMQMAIDGIVDVYWQDDDFMIKLREKA